jgi:membrane protein DedA with SNARE-associated domain
MDNKKKLLMFLGAVVVGMFFISPLLSILGVPGFEVVLTSLFGEDSIFALIFSLLLVLIVIFLLVKLAKKDDSSTNNNT